MAIGDNLSACKTADDALAYVAAITALRDQQAAIETEYQPHLDTLATEANTYRAERDGKTGPLATQEATLRASLKAWLLDDPEGRLADTGGAVLATLAKAKSTVTIDPDKVPAEYKSMQVDMSLINAAIKAKKKVPGVTVTPNYSLKVL